MHAHAAAAAAGLALPPNTPLCLRLQGSVGRQAARGGMEAKTNCI